MAENDDHVEAGTVYLAPPDRHILIGPRGHLRLSASERVRFVRPSADLLFEPVAEVYGPRAIVCVLTGTGSDGAKGVDAVSARGGIIIAQDPGTARNSPACPERR
ncbi:hypothetical protein JMUB6875_03120 [Nocardia sp. JMUB6875]